MTCKCPDMGFLARRGGGFYEPLSLCRVSAGHCARHFELGACSPPRVLRIYDPHLRGEKPSHTVKNKFKKSKKEGEGEEEGGG
jgi:hypothetical protein